MNKETAKDMKISEIIDGQVRNRGLNNALTFEREAVEEMLQEYAKAKCQRQREICQEIFDLTDAQIGDVFKNAPTPDFE